MTNAPFEKIEDFRDLDSINAYYELTEKGVFTRRRSCGICAIKAVITPGRRSSGAMRRMRALPPERRGSW